MKSQKIGNIPYMINFPNDRERASERGEQDERTHIRIHKQRQSPPIARPRPRLGDVGKLSLDKAA